jgi:hypothetical protein
MSGSALKAAIEHYVKNPRKQEDIDSLRGHMTHIASGQPRISECFIEPKVIYDLLILMSEALFGQGSELTKEIISDFTVVNTPDIQTLASYQFNRHTGAKTLNVNCDLISKSLVYVETLGNLRFSNQQYRYSMSPYTKLLLVIEHEYTHLLLEIAGIQNKDEDKHGVDFVRLAHSLFGQGWGDLAFTHISDYESVSGNKDSFIQRLKQKTKLLTDEYIEKVYSILDAQLGAKGALEPVKGGKQTRKKLTRKKRSKKSRRASVYRK